MLIVGEKINTVNHRVYRAVQERDANFIKKLAIAQTKAGADVIDINVGSLPEVEPDNMRWAVQVVQETTNLPLSIDSSNPEAIRAGIEACHQKDRAWANSVTLEQKRLEGVLPTVIEYGCWLVALCLDERGVPPTAAGRVEVARKLVEEIGRWGVPLDRLYLDGLIEPISVKPEAALISLQSVQALRAALPEIKTIICLSGVSFGLPVRRLLNRVYLPLLLHAGVDAIFLDPLDGQLMATLKAAQTLLGRDAYGLDYIAAYRAGLLG